MKIEGGRNLLKQKEIEILQKRMDSDEREQNWKDRGHKCEQLRKTIELMMKLGKTKEAEKLINKLVQIK